ncbi:tail protein X [Paenibacillus melissococcoides]|uniref:Tail protein X n=1 Tax=Paenibacillus melissococcoides TaxID=2912268 RepID=A0ABM9FWT0_9BACL|nr:MULTISPECIES: tail protein X [Paenibacillus]MEB9897323.1 tail protein X [Bacillus cereus]CAH8243637.1 tail protein X [Paenibacillus melissococcoides]CAH8705034.1 tail protein X [Paenibacillus melissococcoides]CAH8707808.1 tail protein X [Paenibacillus melissococcoides]GIO83032.1 membrane protein [Paenibacillus dendritiformis]
MRRYITTQGDTWDIIALQQMGSEMQMTVLMDVNPDYIDTVIFGSGVELHIPEPQQEADADLPPWREDDED